MVCTNFQNSENKLFSVSLLGKQYFFASSKIVENNSLPDVTSTGSDVTKESLITKCFKVLKNLV